MTTFIGQAGSYRKHRGLARAACASARDDMLELAAELRERETRQYGPTRQISAAREHVEGAYRALAYAVQALDED